MASKSDEILSVSSVASEASHEAANSGKVASDGASNEEPTPGAASSSSAAGSPKSLTPMSDEHSATDSARDIVESGSAMCSKSAGAGNLSGNALASGDSHAKYKSVEKEKLGEELPNLKASIYFKLSGGRTRNRTFPGDVNKYGRELLQEWSRQFRYGLSCAKNDNRKVLTSAKRNGTVSIDRAMAFGWFRTTQEKYSELFYHDSDAHKAHLGLGLQNAKKDGQVLGQPNTLERFDQARNRVIKPPPAGTKVAEFYPNEYHHSDESVGSMLGRDYKNEFVEVKWQSYKEFPAMPTTYFMMFGAVKVHVYTHESGRGKS